MKMKAFSLFSILLLLMLPVAFAENVQQLTESELRELYRQAAEKDPEIAELGWLGFILIVLIGIAIAGAVCNVTSGGGGGGPGVPAAFCSSCIDQCANAGDDYDTCLDRCIR